MELNISNILNRIGMQSSMGVPNNMEGGEDPPLTYEQRKHWNGYVDFLEKKGYKGSPLLDKKDTGLAKGLFDQYLKENPNSPLTYDHIKSVQTEMQQLQKASREFGERHGNKDADKIMEGISNVDGWPGSKTTSFKFPDLTFQQTHNNKVGMQKNLGLVDTKLQTATTPLKKLPPGAKLEQMADGWYYENEQGELIKYK